jgi:hypothetical protein
MRDCYVTSALRHAADADLLCQEGRCDNAAYLAGYAVECSLKALVTAASPSVRRVQTHELDRLLGSDVTLAVHLRPELTSYIPRASVDLDDLMRDWSVALRYAGTGATAIVRARRWTAAAARAAHEAVIEAVMDGVVQWR